MAAKAYYIPNGPVNLETVFPMIDFNQVSEYFIELVDAMDVVIASTTLNDIKGCEDDDDKIRIHFLNKLGTIDAINFKRVKKDHDSKSDSFEKPLQYPLDKTAHGIGRFNVKSNKSYTAVTKDYAEEDMDWLDEMRDAPIAWMQFPSLQGQPATFIPVIITDGKGEDIKEDDRHTYQYTIEFTLSHEIFNIRN